MAKLDVAFTAKARELLKIILNEHPSLALVLDDTTCCTVSNVFARSEEPPWEAERIATYLGSPVYVHPSLRKSLKTRRVTIDVIDFADDSLSLETDYGKRFVMITSEGIRR